MNTHCMFGAKSYTDVLEIYGSIETVTAEMLHAAQTGRWDDVLLFGEQYKQAVGLLREAQGLLPTTDSERRERHRALTAILSNDAMTRALLSPELDRLGALISGGKNQKMAIRAYGIASSLPNQGL